MTTQDDKAFREQVGRIETLIGEIEAFPDSGMRDRAVELVQAVMDLHGAALERMLDMTWEKGEVGRELIDEFGQDEALRGLLLLHGLHPLDLETRVTQALDKVRPYLGSHGGDVELLGLEDGVVRLRLQGSCNGCASSAMTLKLAIEEAIQEFAPDIAGMEVEGVVEPPPVPPSGFIPLTQVGGLNGQAAPSGPAPIGRWESLGDLSSLPRATTRSIDVGGHRVLICRLDGTFYAYENTCPACGHLMDSAGLKGSAVACPTCSNTYDITRAGRCLDRPDLHLEPFPLLEQQGKVKIALPQKETIR